MSNHHTIAAIVLAAGESRRFNSGESKMLAQLTKGQTLLEKSLQALAYFNPADIVVVTGRAHEQIQQLLPRHHCHYNANYELGLSQSIRAGLEYLESSGNTYDAVLILLADQVDVTAGAVNALLDEYRQHIQDQPAPVIQAVASCFGAPTIMGPPAIFSRPLFHQLAALEGDRGARQLLETLISQGRLQEFALPAAAIDIDTMEDLQNYKKTD